MKKISIQQPEHLPWLGFWDKLRQVNEIVLLDNVQFKKGYFENRNKIKSANGPIWLSVPVLTKGRLDLKINEVEIDNSHEWAVKCFKSLDRSYKKSKYWDDYYLFFQELYNKKWNKLVDLNVSIIKFIANEFGLNKKFYLASELEPDGSSTELLVNICKKVEAECYLSGIGGRNYLDEELFRMNDIRLEYQKFNHPVYPQLFGDFIDGMSSVDILFNCGKDSLSIIEKFNKN